VKYTVTPKNAKALAIPVLMSGLCPMFSSSPGVGKSAIAAEICKEFNLEMVDIRLSTVDPTDLNGFIAPNLETGRADYLPPSVFPIEGMDTLPKGKDGWLIFFDEITAAPPSIQAAAYKVILDRMVGAHKIHPKAVMMAAGNGVKDNAVASRMSTALQSRMVHFEMVVNSKEWIEYAIAKKFDSRVVAYVEHRPDVLSSFDPKHTDKTFCCPRTMEFLSKILAKLPAGLPVHDYSYMPLYAGTVGDGIGTEFRAFLEIYKELIKFETVVNNPKHAPIPEEPSALFALSGVIGERTDKDNILAVMQYVERLPIEHQVSCIKKIGAGKPELKTSRAFINWLDDNAKKLF
jgi:hypothetical protein